MTDTKDSPHQIDLMVQQPPVPPYSVLKTLGGSWEWQVCYVHGGKVIGWADSYMDAEACACETARLTREANVLQPGQAPLVGTVSDLDREFEEQAAALKVALKPIEMALQRHVLKVEAMKRERVAQRLSQKQIRSQSNFLRSLSRRNR